MGSSSPKHLEGNRLEMAETEVEPTETYRIPLYQMSACEKEREKGPEYTLTKAVASSVINGSQSQRHWR